MDYEAIGNGLKWIGIGIASWPVCKYVAKPLAERLIGVNDAFIKLRLEYNKHYQKLMEQRTALAIELGKTNRSTKEISDIVDSIVPAEDVNIKQDGKGIIVKGI